MLQTALDLLELNYNVHIIADGVSSCNKEEIPIALDRIRQAGGQITTSESAAFQLQRRISFYHFSTSELTMDVFKVTRLYRLSGHSRA